MRCLCQHFVFLFKTSMLNKCKIIVWFPEEDRESAMPPQSGDRPLPPPPSRESQEYQECHHRQAPQSQETSAVETPTPADVFHPKDLRPQPEVFHPMDPPPLPPQRTPRIHHKRLCIQWVRCSCQQTLIWTPLMAWRAMTHHQIHHQAFHSHNQWQHHKGCSRSKLCSLFWFGKKDYKFT